MANSWTVLHDGVNGNLRQQIGVLTWDTDSATPVQLTAFDRVYSVSGAWSPVTIDGTSIRIDSTAWAGTTDATLTVLGV